MTHQLEAIFGELGIAQYLDAFLDQGFDTWETILDIQESDLDALGVKLGHRRKLQRRIANSRGLAPEVSLTSPPRLSIEDSRSDVLRQDSTWIEHKDATVVTKRKYRRHPKPDDNAPERPPSAYVLFSNKMREDLKGQNLTFTEIAKLVGERWQALPPLEKEPFESQAMRAKEKYNHDLAEYKKTAEFKKYSQYLQDFKQKQANQSQAKDVSKRVKLEPARNHHGSSSSAATPGSASRSGSRTGSGSDSPPAHERHRPREYRHGSSISIQNSRTSATAPTMTAQRSVAEEQIPSPSSTQFSEQSHGAGPSSPRDSYHHRRDSQGWNGRQMSVEMPNGLRSPLGGQSGSEMASHPPLPPLSDMLQDSRHVLRQGDGNGYPNLMPSHLPRTTSGLSSSRPPTLRHESTSSTSIVSSGSSFFPRTPSDGSLPIRIDALLSNKSGPGGPPYYSPQAISPDQQSPFFPPGTGGHASGGGQDFHSPPPQHSPISTDCDIEGTSRVERMPDTAPSSRHRAGGLGAADNNRFDGMSALLRAGEIVDGRHR